MSFKFAFGMALAVALAAGAAAADPVYTLAKVVPLGAPDRWDYLFFDPSAKRVYVSHGDEVTVVDGESGAVIGALGDQPGSHGVTVIPALKRGFADSAKNKTVTIFDSASLKPLGTAPAGDDADGVAYDAATARVFVANGGAQALTVIDGATGKLLATVALGGEPEFLVGDGMGRIYVNMASTREIVAVDAKTLKVAQRFAISDCERPHGLAIDVANARLFSSCVNQKLMVVDAASGRIVATLPIGKGTDAAAFDPARKRIYSANGVDGTLSVIAEKSADDYALLGNVPTVKGARTMTLDPETGRVYVVAAEIDHVDPPKEPGGRPHAVFKPGTVKLYFYDPAP